MATLTKRNSLFWWGIPFFMKQYYLKTGLFLVSLFFISCNTRPMNPLETIMASDAPKIKAINEQLAQHEVQILYSRIERDSQGFPSFEEFNFQLDDNRYFYPASTAKMPVAILALQRINELQAAGYALDENSRFTITDPKSETIIIDKDSTSENGQTSIAHMIKKIFLVSDNDAYNYLFDFLGRDYINAELQKRGMGPAHINHKFLFGADNKNTWEFKFYNAQNEVIYEQGSLTSQTDKHTYQLTSIVKGLGYTDNDGNLFNEAFDFSEKNYFSLRSLNRILKSVVFPEVFEPKDRFDITDKQYDFLRFWMSRNTLESEYPNYDVENYYESYVKFLMFGDDKAPMPKNVRVFNKVGDAYGTLTDVAYIVDSENAIEFMLSATVHVNENQIFNDGIYEYEELGFPFLAELGRHVYQYELELKN